MRRYMMRHAPRFWAIIDLIAHSITQRFFVCGIFGIIIEREQPLDSILIDATRRLPYRGYDSVGCTLHADRTSRLRIMP